MTRRWHFWLLVILVIIGLVVVLWPLPVTEKTPAQSPEEPPAPDTATIPAAESFDDVGEPPEPAKLVAESSGSLLNEQAINAWYTGNIVEAITLFEQAISADPNNPDPHSNYGRLLTLMVSYEKALPLLERARDLKPGDAQVWLDLATLYERTQMLNKSWAAQGEAAKLVGSEAITRDEQGRFVVEGSTL